MTTARNDRILFWPPFLAIVLATAFSRESVEPEILNADTVLIFLFWPASTCVGFVLCVIAIIKRAWLRLLSTMILPLSILVWFYGKGLWW